MIKCDPILLEFVKENFLTLGTIAAFLIGIAKRFKWTWLSNIVEAATEALKNVGGRNAKK